MAAKFAEIFIKLGLKKEGFDKEVKKTSTSMADMGKSILKTGAIIGGMATGAVLAGKALFNMGKSGAAAIQTGESFQFLIDKVGAAPDLLDQLTEATLGTVDAGTLMSSTLTLTAGAGDDLTRMMMEAAPQLARIAKAANKLNPALGDTAFMYQSIGTGVKRAQPLILDNLGLTLKVGAANEDFAKSIGKTVEQLTAEEKAMAILNATLEAGDNLIAQVGGSVESATDEFEQMEAKVENLKSQLLTGLAPAISDTVDQLIPVVDGVAGFIKVEDLLKDALDNNIITLEEYKQQIRANMTFQLGLADATEWVTFKTEEYEKALGRNYGNLDANAELMLKLRKNTYLAADASDDFSSSLEDVGLAAAGTKDAIEGLTDTLTGVYASALKASTDSVYELERAKLVMKLATQNLSQAEIEHALNMLDSINRIEILTQAVKDGEVSQRDLRLAIMDGIVTQDEFNTMMGITTGKAGKMGDAIDYAAIKAWYLRDGLAAASGDWEATFRLKIIGGVIPKLPKGVDYVPLQHGGSFTVPPGYPNDSMLLGVSSGEHVQVTPRGRGGGRNNYYSIRYGDQNIIQNPAQAAFLIEKEHQAEFDEIDKVI